MTKAIDSTNAKLELSTENLAIGFTHNRQQRIVAEKINVTLRPGELTCLIGPNGAGKSTLMRTLAGMQPPLAGRVRLGDADLHQLPPAELAQRLAVVLTERVDVGNLSAYALVALGRHPYTDWRGRLAESDQRAVALALEQVKATPLANRSINELSDGERQRVMIARALAQLSPHPPAPSPEGFDLPSGDGEKKNEFVNRSSLKNEAGKVLILDEPTAFLDLPRRVEMMQLLGMLARTSRCAVLLSTHDLDLALRVADRLWLLSATGELIDGLPEELVLDGSLAATFQSEGIEFDPAAGSFKLHRHPCGPIGFQGEGLAAEWTRRALERVGFAVLADEEAQSYRVHVNGDWKVITLGGVHRFEQLSEMIEFVKNS